jgi:hypothetical protein
VIVTGAFFADHAAVVDNKLVVVGGVWDDYLIGEDQPMAIDGHLVVLLQTDPSEDDHATVSIDIFGPDGEQLSAIQVEHAVRQGTGQGFIQAPLSIGLREIGRHSFVVGVAEQEPVALWLQVHQAE